MMANLMLHSRSKPEFCPCRWVGSGSNIQVSIPPILCEVLGPEKALGCQGTGSGHALVSSCCQAFCSANASVPELLRPTDGCCSARRVLRPAGGSSRSHAIFHHDNHAACSQASLSRHQIPRKAHPHRRAAR